MARLMVRGDRLVLRLNPLEKLLDFRLVSPTVPVAAMDSVDIIDDPTNLMETETSFGFAGSTARNGLKLLDRLVREANVAPCEAMSEFAIEIAPEASAYGGRTARAPLVASGIACGLVRLQA